MNTKTFGTLVAIVSLSLIAVPAFAGNGKRFVLNLVGTGQMYQSTVPDIDGDGIDDDASCFDVDVFDLRTGRLAGTGSDCLANVQVVGGGIALVGTTYFNLKQGELVTRGNTTVQPVNHPTTTTDGHLITHTTGASGAGNSIVSGTKRFRNASGTARLSGLVDLSNFGGLPGDPIFFDCIFVIELD